MRTSGIDGTNNILMSLARVRVENGTFKEATIEGEKGEYYVLFTNDEALWKGKPIVLSSSRNPYAPKVFKTIDAAVADIKNTGLKVENISMRDST